VRGQVEPILEVGELETLKSFDEFLEKCFPESGGEPITYYLVAIHEHLPRIAKPKLAIAIARVDELMGWIKSPKLVKGKGGPEGRTEVRLCTLGARGLLDAQEIQASI